MSERRFVSVVVHQVLAPLVACYLISFVISYTHRQLTRHFVWYNDAACEACVCHRCMSCGRILLLSTPSTRLYRASGKRIVYLGCTGSSYNVFNVPSIFNTRLGGGAGSFI